MSHITIVISKAFNPLAGSADHQEQPEPSYEYEIPVPHNATPQQVGELVRKAYKRLESSDD